MLILSDCICEKRDEGCLKVANSLAQGLKKACPLTTVVSYGLRESNADVYLEVNPLFINFSLAKLLRTKREPVLYIPFASNTFASTVRILVLSFLNPEKVTVLFALRHPMNRVSQLLLKWSGAKVLSLSGESQCFYQKIIGSQAVYLKTGVDIKQFVPVTQDVKMALRRKYGIPEDRKVVLHVGHLNRGRNVQSLEKLTGDHMGLLVLSSETKAQREEPLRQELEKHENVRILDSYIPQIQEIYQLSDVYLFPVMEAEACIDVPLSVLEASACGLPVLCTAFGELREFFGKEGFFFPERDDFCTEEINRWVDRAISCPGAPRTSAEAYDWDAAIQRLIYEVET